MYRELAVTRESAEEAPWRKKLRSMRRRWSVALWGTFKHRYSRCVYCRKLWGKFLGRDTGRYITHQLCCTKQFKIFFQ